MITTTDPLLIILPRAKLSVPGNEPADSSSDKFHELRRQVEVQLKPVVRENGLTNFGQNTLAVPPPISTRIYANPEKLS